MNEPIILFVYARIDHVRKTIDSLLNNLGVDEHDLIIYSDAAASVDKVHAVEAVRDYAKTIAGFRSVSINYRSQNYGLARSIIEGVTEVLSRHERVIVLEDDMVTSPYFLTYMTEALDRFAEDDRVISVHGYMYPIKVELPEAFFLCGADCWGWATWRRGWSIFNPDGKYLLNELRQKKVTQKFDFNGAYKYTQMLEDQINGKNDSWAIRWHASAFLANKLTLYPGRSLVQNIGNDSSGTHCETTTELDVVLSATPICLQNVIVEESILATKAVQDFFQSKRTFLQRIILRLIPKVVNQQLMNFIKRKMPPVMIAWLRKF